MASIEISDPVSTIIGTVGTIIDKIFPDKDEAMRVKLKMIELDQAGQLEEAKISLSAINTEASSTDRWTSRARPTFLYIMYLLIVMAIPMGFVSIYDPVLPMSVADAMGRWLNAIPEALWWLFGAGYLGYNASRSFDKWKTTKIGK